MYVCFYFTILCVDINILLCSIALLTTVGLLMLEVKDFRNVLMKTLLGLLPMKKSTDLTSINHQATDDIQLQQLIFIRCDQYSSIAAEFRPRKTIFIQNLRISFMMADCTG
jgi:hypothetical protein